MGPFTSRYRTPLLVMGMVLIIAACGNEDAADPEESGEPAASEGEPAEEPASSEEEPAGEDPEGQVTFDSLSGQQREGADHLCASLHDDFEGFSYNQVMAGQVVVPTNLMDIVDGADGGTDANAAADLEEECAAMGWTPS